MYIPYYEISQILSIFLPKSLKKYIEDWGYQAKIKQNVEYIKNNKKNVLYKLKNKKVLRVAFYVYDESKWKCESVYNQMKLDDRFDPFIFVTKNDCKLKNNPNYQTSKDVKKCYQFFKDHGYNVKYGYNTKLKKFIPMQKFAPDIIIYQHPWYVETSQGPVVSSKYALTSYVPYYLPTGVYNIDCYLRFHQYVESYYVLNDILKDEYKPLMANKGDNLKSVGQPFLDYYSNNSLKQKKYVIYAPHWTVAQQGLGYSTFEQYGEFILTYAKKHPEHEWVFKPHPLLYKSLIKNNIMTESEVRNYYNEWSKVGITYNMGNYIDIFNQSKMLITDRSSFLGEYFMTGNPVIYLVPNSNNPFNKTLYEIMQTYYHVSNLNDLEYLLSILPKDDYLRKERINVAESLGFVNNNAAKNIICDIVNEIYN